MIAKLAQLTVRPANSEDLQPLANLVHFEAHVHRHLDWRAPLDWVGYHPYLVAESDGKIQAALACPPDPPGVAWIRLFAVSSEVSVRRAWEELWLAALNLFSMQDMATSVAAIPLHTWFRNLLEKSEFIRTYNIIVLSWKRGVEWELPTRSSLLIRTMQPGDLDGVAAVDVKAFGRVWQNSRDSLEIAFRQAAVATVALEGDEIVGYQISTATPMGGHLARLAIDPVKQGKGTGYALLVDLLAKFEQRGAQSVTVNTQQDNLVSLKLYQKAGFKRTGEEYPVYQFPIDGMV